MLSPNTRYHETAEAYFKLAEKSINRGLSCGLVTPDDAALIKKFALRHKQAVSPGRYAKIVSLLVNVKRYFPVEYSKVDTDSYLEALANIKYATKEDGTPYSANSITDWSKIAKRFFKFLHSQNLTSVSLDVINGTKTGGYDYYTKTEDDVMTADEINRIITVARGPKYKAYFGMLYELGARSIELANLRWQDLTFNAWGISCNLRDAKAGSTPKMRSVPCIMYAKYVADWRSQYPGRPTGENFVFITPSGNPIQYQTVYKALKQFCKEAGIERHVTLHRFRHTRITHVLREGMNETLCKKAFWGNQSTEMIATYGHLTSSDLEDACLQMAGVDIPHTKVEQAPKPVQCPQCHHLSPPGSRICPVCGKAMTPELEEEINDEIKTLDQVFARFSDEQKLQVLAKMSQLIE